MTSRNTIGVGLHANAEVELLGLLAVPSGLVVLPECSLQVAKNTQGVGFSETVLQLLVESVRLFTVASRRLGATKVAFEAA
jgi:hypothetical protein